MKREFPHPPVPERPEFWRSPAELENAAAFEDRLREEFPRGASVYEDSGMSKRDFMKLLGASMALAGVGLSGCRRPEEHIVPFTRGAEWEVPGKFLYYATAMPLRRGAMPLIAATVDGRPTKLEGNPLHPCSNGTTDAFAQASILDLYDPHRSKAIKRGGEVVEESEFDVFLKNVGSAKGDELAFLVERKNSPTRDRLRDELCVKFPGMLWCEYEPLGGEEEKASALCFGEGVRLIPKFDKADVVLALDCDFLNPTDKGVEFAAGFFVRRDPKTASMNRLYVVENHFTVTGGMADHRYRCKASQVGEFARRLAEVVAQKTGNLPLASVLAVAPKATSPFDEGWIAECADDLLAHPSRSVVLVGSLQPLWVQVLGAAVNEALGNHGSTLVGRQAPNFNSVSIEDLAGAVAGGKVKTLFILGGNPVYNAPANLGFAELLRTVPYAVHLGLFEDETSKLTRWHIPAAHYLESWGDVCAFDGSYTSIQPMILPLWQGMNELEILARLAGRPQPKGPELIQETFAQRIGANDPEEWNAFLRNGFLPESAWPDVALAFRVPASMPVQSAGEGIELVFLASASVDDGRYANNSWLQETPDFETKLTWDNAALMSAATAKKLGLREKSGEEEFDLVADVVEIAAGKTAITAAVLIAPGHADDSISLALGYGRRGVSALMEGVGFDAYPLRTSEAPRFRAGITVRSTGKTYPFARTQEARSMAGRDLVRQGTLEEYEKAPTFAQKGDAPAVSISPKLTAKEQWGMAIDLNTCIGCNACVVACQAENNVPVVGKEQVRKNRDMAWLRIDRYFAGEPEDPEMLGQPMLCQHCEDAPCETVCPVNATVHSEEGLNLMTYNRCIGTRFCANNCPWKVRRFNFFDYNERPLDQLYDGPLAPKGMAESLKLVKNPNVTVRMRGVMEKCTFCIQRIEEAKITRLTKAGARDKNKVPLPEFKTACQQACPSNAMVFGNIRDPDSAVSRVRASDRGYVTLNYLNTNPRVTYLARIKNPNPRMP